MDDFGANSISDVIGILSSHMCPLLTNLFKIFISIPPTSASAERSFSVLREVKNVLRSTMSEQRLNDLCLVYVHKDLSLEENAVIDEFSKLNHRLKFSTE